MVTTITAAAFCERLKADPGAAVLDVRTLPEYRAAHLAAPCCHMPLDALDMEKIRAQFPDTSRPLYVLCKGGVRAAKAAEALQKSGFGNAVVVEGGLDACTLCGTDIQQGAVLSLERQVRIAAGALVLTGVILGSALHPVFYWLAAFVGAGLIFAGVSGWCGMALLLAKAPWNK